MGRMESDYSLAVIASQFNVLSLPDPFVGLSSTTVVQQENRDGSTPDGESLLYHSISQEDYRWNNVMFNRFRDAGFGVN